MTPKEVTLPSLKYIPQSFESGDSSKPSRLLRLIARIADALSPQLPDRFTNVKGGSSHGRGNGHRAER